MDAQEPAFEIIAGNERTGLLLIADHAMNRVPADEIDLGLPPESFHRHIAYDIGVEMLTRHLAACLDVPAVMGRFSRLLIDPNRGEDDPTLIMKLSDGEVVPGNHPLAAGERERRLDRYHRPYHKAIAAMIAKVEELSGGAPLVISLHSFTPFWKGVPRPWHAAVLWDSDPRAARPFVEALRRDPALMIGENEPYEGALEGDTLYRHCTTSGLANALLEVRQDLIASEEDAKLWALKLQPILEQINALPDIHERKTYPSRATAEHHAAKRTLWR